MNNDKNKFPGNKKKVPKKKKYIYKRIQISNACDMEMLLLSYISLLWSCI